MNAPLNTNSNPDYYSQLGLPNPEFLSLRLLTETRRANEAALEYGKIHTLDRLVSTNRDLLRSAHYDGDLKLVSETVVVPAIEQALENYKRHLLRAGIHLTEASLTLHDSGSAKSYELVSSDYKLTSQYYGLAASITSIESGFTNISSKQLVFNNAYTHLISDIEQHVTKDYWLRTENQHTLVARTSTNYVTDTAENYYANLRDTAGDRLLLCDHYLVQVGTKFESSNVCGGFGGIAGLVGAGIGSLTQVSRLTELVGGLPVVGNLVNTLGDASKLGEFIGGLGGTDLVSGLLESVGGLPSLADIGDLSVVGDFFEQFDSVDEIVRATGADELLSPLTNLVGSATSIEELRSNLNTLGSLQAATEGRLLGDERLVHPTSTKLNGEFGSYTVRAERSITFETPGAVKFKAGCIDFGNYKELRLAAQNVVIEATSSVDIASNAPLSVSSSSTVRIDGGIVFINSLAPRPVVITPTDNTIEAIPRGQMDNPPPLPRAPLAQTQSAAGVDLGGQTMLLPPTGTAGPLAGIAPSEGSSYRRTRTYTPDPNYNPDNLNATDNDL